MQQNALFCVLEIFFLEGRQSPLPLPLLVSRGLACMCMDTLILNWHETGQNKDHMPLQSREKLNVRNNYNVNHLRLSLISTFLLKGNKLYSARFTYRLDRLKPRVSQFRGPPSKVHNIFNTVIGLPHVCCHSVLYFINNFSVIFLTQLHSISEYCRILNTTYHLCLYWNWLNALPFPLVVKVGNWERPCNNLFAPT